MQKAINTLRKNAGYISIETVIVAGLVIGLGALAISAFESSANGVMGKGLTQVSNVQNNFSQLQAP